MEGKNMILSVLIMSLVISQIQVEAKSCCPDGISRSCYNICLAGTFKQLCAQLCSCKDIAGTRCPPGYTNDILKNSGDDVNTYCKLGCASSVCGALTTLQNSDASGIVNGAVEQCTNACSTFCTKGSAKAVKTA